MLGPSTELVRVQFKTTSVGENRWDLAGAAISSNVSTDMQPKAAEMERRGIGLTLIQLTFQVALFRSLGVFARPGQAAAIRRRGPTSMACGISHG